MELSSWSASFSGAYIFMCIGREYLSQGKTLEVSTAYRLAYLMPGEISDKAVAFLDEIVSEVRKRAYNFVAVSFIERIFRFMLRWETSRGAPL